MSAFELQCLEWFLRLCGNGKSMREKEEGGREIDGEICNFWWKSMNVLEVGVSPIM